MRISATATLLLLTLQHDGASAFSAVGSRSKTTSRQAPTSLLRQQQRAAATGLNAVLSPSDATTGFLGGAFQSFGGNNTNKKGVSNTVDQFFQAWNERDFNALINQFADDCTFEDANYPGPFEGKDAINRHFRLLADTTTSQQQFVLDNMAVTSAKVGVLYHLEENNEVVPDSRHSSFFTLDEDSGLITSVFDTVEPSSKTGAADLAVLAVVGKLLEGTAKKGGDDDAIATATDELVSFDNSNPSFFDQLFNSKSKPGRNNRLNAAERYFAAWNQRDMDAAIDVFTDDCQYEDTVFPVPFEGKEALQKHLYLCADSMPSTFSFVVDDVADSGGQLSVRWHVENNGDQMPFTRGCSFYTIDQSSGLIATGIDEVEPAVFKLGGVKLFAESLKKKIIDEPVRLVALAVWVAYMYIVFFSDGILPGANALQLEQRTWEEVRDLSLNFFLVSPLLNLPFSPTVHPVLEGVFNLLLSWAALFAGFLSDDRKDKPNLFPMLPAVVGMQFLTSAFLLPYLTLRTSETLSEGDKVDLDELDTPAQLVESRLLGLLLGGVGSGALVWGAIARMSEFGGIDERLASFWQLMSIDRVGSSFLVDLAIFAVFQGWLIDDDLRRRGVSDDEQVMLRNSAKYVPFFGLASYMVLRPPILAETNGSD